MKKIALFWVLTVVAIVAATGQNSQDEKMNDPIPLEFFQQQLNESQAGYFTKQSKCEIQQVQRKAQTKSDFLAIKEYWLSMSSYPSVSDGIKSVYVVNKNNNNWAKGQAVISSGKVVKFKDESGKAWIVTGSETINKCKSFGSINNLNCYFYFF